MSMKTLLLLAIVVVLVSFSTARNVDGKEGFEMNMENASFFLHATTEESAGVMFDKRESGRNCVPCKFGINPCCAPNICRKKTLWPDECMEIKLSGSGIIG